MSFSVDGLISGLSTSDFISSLLQAEAAPQTLLKTKQSTTSTLVGALQGLNTKVASLAETARAAAATSSWGAAAGSASAPSVAVTASVGAPPTELSLTVDQVARSQVSLTDTFADVPGLLGGTTLTVRAGDGTLTEVTIAADATVDDLARAISRSDAGVSAVAVRTAGSTRLQLTGSQTGAGASFEVFAGTAAQVTGGTAAPFALTTTRTAQDAVITLWPGSAAAQQVVSPSSTFSDLLTGTSLTVSAVEAEPVTVRVTRDERALRDMTSGLVGALGVALSEIVSRTSSTTTTSSDGREVVTGGVLSGASGVRDLSAALQRAASYPVDGVSPSEIGVVIQKDGTFTFDEQRFSAALAADPGKVQRIVSTLAGRVADVATAASDPYEGTVTRQIASQEKQVADLGAQIEDWDRRLELRREGLQATYARLEVTLSSLQSQSSWLSSQLASLSGGTSVTG